MKKHILQNLEVYKFEIFEKEQGLEHCFTTKNEGTSLNQYYSLNLGYNTGDLKKNIDKNYSIVLDKVFKSKKIIRGIQTHSDNIKIIDNSEDIEHNVYDNIDGFITDKKNIVLSTTYADCVPIFFYDKSKKIIGISHSGWKGTYKKISQNIIKNMVEIFNSSLEDIIVGIGPSIGENSYEVGEELLEKFSNIGLEDCFTRKNGNLYFNIKEANKKIVLSAGISEENIEMSHNCTFNQKDEFYSYRRDKGDTGRMAGMIMLK